MITFNNWVISNSGLIAYQFDNLSAYLEITGDIPTGWTWNLYLQSGANLNIVSLTETENGIGIELTAEMLALSGYYYIQLQGTQGDVVKHTNIIQVYIPRSLSGNVQWPTVPSEFTQVEQRIQTLNSNPPYPGDDGYWMIYDIDSGAYIQSSLPLPPVAEGPPGPEGPQGPHRGRKGPRVHRASRDRKVRRDRRENQGRRVIPAHRDPRAILGNLARREILDRMARQAKMASVSRNLA